MTNANYFVSGLDNASQRFGNRSKIFDCLTGVRKILYQAVCENISLLIFDCDTKGITAQFQQNISQRSEIISEELF